MQNAQNSYLASPAVFQEYKSSYIHSFETKSDTGIELNMLQNFIFIPVDIFLENLHNNGIRDDLDAWLTFLGCDEPEYIIDLIEEYPYFKRLYEDLYTMCQNTERVMDMFSKELQILDRNTVSYMIDEMQAEIDKAKAIIADKDAELADRDNAIAELKAQNDKTIAEMQAQNDKAMAEMQAQNDKAMAEMQAQNDKAMAEMQAQNAMLTAKLSEHNK